MPKVLQEALEPLQYLMAAVTLVGVMYLCYMQYVELQEHKAAVRQGLIPYAKKMKPELKDQLKQLKRKKVDSQ